MPASERSNNAILRGTNVRYAMIPILAGSGAGGIALTASGAGSWGIAYAAPWDTLAAANAITTEYFVHGVNLYTFGGVGVYELQLSSVASPASIADVYANFGIDCGSVVTAVPAYLPILNSIIHIDRPGLVPIESRMCSLSSVFTSSFSYSSFSE